MDSTIKIYKGRGLEKTNNSDGLKTFVFDLDETIGSFSELYILFKCIEYMKTDLKLSIFDNDKKLLFSLLDLFPEFFRYGISVIFQYLHEKKQITNNISIYIYTNNSCIPISWTSIIVKYMEEKFGVENLFDNIIRAFKIGNQIVEYNRTTATKTYKDLIRCVHIPENTELCFIDNVEYPKMKHRHVYYIQPKPYYHYVNRSEIIERFINSQSGNLMQSLVQDKLENLIMNYYNKNDYVLHEYKKTKEELENDILITKKIMYHIKHFFYMKIRKIKTRKKRTVINFNQTRKLH
jgi:hypothetical protein